VSSFVGKDNAGWMNGKPVKDGLQTSKNFGIGRRVILRDSDASGQI
jgi:hypothetical protein